MKTGFTRVLFILILLAGGTLAGVFFLRKNIGKETFVDAPQVYIEGIATPLSVSVADTPFLQAKGLSNHVPLKENEGMLFLFDTPSKLSFWMKDMLFSIDIIWIGSDWKIVDITKMVTPESYPETFSPVLDAQYVLEVPAGFSAAHNLRIGQSVIFEK